MDGHWLYLLNRLTFLIKFIEISEVMKQVKEPF